MEGAKYKILLIEDDELDQNAFKRMADEKRLPYNCTIAGSVAEAKKILSTTGFDIIIADYLLGDGTVFGVLDSVKNTPVIIITGAGDEEVAVQAWKAGTCDYMIKDHERNYLKAVPAAVENTIRHKKTEQRLRLLSAAILSTDESIYITDLENKITFVNKAFCETYGYTEQEIIGKDCNILWRENPLITDAKNIYHVVSGWEVGFLHRRKDGTEFPVSMSRSDVKDENGSEIARIVISRDISERMRVENELREANRNLQKQLRLRKELTVAACNQLIALVTELKNIISQTIINNTGKMWPGLQGNLESADRNLNKTKTIISDFLDVLQIDANKLNVELNELNLRSVISQVLKALSPLATEKDIDLESSMPDSNIAIKTDWEKIIRMLANLAGAAAKKAPAEDDIGSLETTEVNAAGQIET
jgi:PAS domain S-box-containing protein